MSFRTVYNERAWGIDLISAINQRMAASERAIRSAGGEFGIVAKGRPSLFPDILLFGDASAHALVLQGWELKFPDTPVLGNTALVENALEKCRRLQLSSFLLWNGTTAVLYVCEHGSVLRQVKTWNCKEVQKRTDVFTYRHELEKLLFQILGDLNDFFEKGKIRIGEECSLGSQLQGLMGQVIDDYVGTTEAAIRQKAGRSRPFRLAVADWWRRCRVARDLNGDVPCDYEDLARELLVHEVNRFFFVSCLRQSFQDAEISESLGKRVDAGAFEAFFENLTRRHDFSAIFSRHFASEAIPPVAWRALCDFHRILQRTRLDGAPQADLQGVMQSIVDAERRKPRGQFCTPPMLANLLVALTIGDAMEPVLDPCCGTGTIPRAVFDFKRHAGLAVGPALQTVYGSDVDPAVLQFATLALARCPGAFETIRLFEADAFTLRTGSGVRFTDAKTGQVLDEHLPSFPCIITNPPFIRFEDWKETMSIRETRRFLSSRLDGIRLDAKADYCVLMVLSFWRLLATNGRLGLVLPDSWLGAGWSVSFRAALRKLFQIECIVISGAGRWFPNAKVVATLVVLARREGAASEGAGATTFAVTRQPIESWTVNEVDSIAAQVCLPNAVPDGHLISRQAFSADEIGRCEKLGLSWIALFADLRWLDAALPMTIAVSDLFEVERGERRGWNDLFYPENRSVVESEFLCPVLRSSKFVHGLIAKADGSAFSCSLDEEELRRRNFTKTLRWIDSFRSAANEKGRPLPEVLARAGYQWYEMRRDARADFALSMNPDERLFVMRFAKPTFVDQRLIRLTVKRSQTVNLELCHALLNSVVSVYFQEALGFGRGEGVLDLSATRVKESMRMLDPGRLSPEAGRRIVDTFVPLTRRDIQARWEEEMIQSDRINFERTVLHEFGLDELFDSIFRAIQTLHRVRKAALQCEGVVRRGASV